MRGLVWTLAFMASGVLHVGLFVLGPMVFAPDPIDDQPRPQSELRIETQEVARSESSATAPAGEATATQSAEGAAIAQGAIPQSRAAAEPVVSAPVQPVAAPEPIVASAAPVQSAVIAASPATVTPATDMSPDVVVAATDLSRATTLAPSAPPAATVTQAAPPPALVVATAAPTGTAVASVAMPDAVAAAAPPAGQVMSAGDLPATEITAALAWSGNAQSQLDQQALDAIQSFMRPGDARAQAGDVRDALTDLLSQVPCARLQAEFDPETGSIVLRGHIPEEDLRAPVLAALQAQVGTGLPVVDAMLILPRPQCGALAGIGTVGLPQSTEALTNPLLIGADAHARAYTYRDGDQLILDMQAPDYDAYVYVDYFDASGNVIHLVPNDTVPLVLHPAKSAMRIGQSVNGEPALAITIGPPFGQEIAVAFAASAPLYDGLRPISEPAEPYLTWLREQVAAARAADPDFKGEWVYFFISTRAD
jgi:hypothetical protein